MNESIYKGSDVITRYPEVILSKDDVPYESNLTFNAGIVKEKDGYLMLFRNDYGCTQPEWEAGKRFKGTNIGLARSRDGIRWTVDPEPSFELKQLHNEEFVRCYDPRITAMDGHYYVCFAVDTKHGVHGGICVTDDFKTYDILSISVPDNRNMVLFPEKINGKYVRLERPMPVYSRDGKDLFDIWISESPDLVYWGNSKLVLATEDVPYCNDKIGPGAPPLKTDKGWLVIFHAVDIDPTRGKNGWENYWRKRYCIGVMLLDLEDPSKVIGMSKKPLMIPEAPYELAGGFRNNALFPCGMVRDDEGLIRIYYSAGDAVVRMATAKEEDLIALCCEKRK
ncbi:MAG: glycoside hydrolase family 130 protein [Clostridia bacterium]|nr:glycoside hydrolase family 130 protein [Clostridia bacterium]